MSQAPPPVLTRHPRLGAPGHPPGRVPHTSRLSPHTSRPCAHSLGTWAHLGARCVCTRDSPRGSLHAVEALPETHPEARSTLWRLSPTSLHPRRPDRCPSRPGETLGQRLSPSFPRDWAGSRPPSLPRSQPVPRVLRKGGTQAGTEGRGLTGEGCRQDTGPAWARSGRRPQTAQLKSKGPAAAGRGWPSAAGAWLSGSASQGHLGPPGGDAPPP